ncbi:hypothetical protein GQ53DRAFT_883745 [Thozetella sp. PMI_491]|nr:hypothetical protein GQ53DRAFT_883745 [Thozetella sp. PMI_491]
MEPQDHDKLWCSPPVQLIRYSRDWRRADCRGETSIESIDRVQLPGGSRLGGTTTQLQCFHDVSSTHPLLFPGGCSLLAPHGPARVIYKKLALAADVDPGHIFLAICVQARIVPGTDASAGPKRHKPNDNDTHACLSRREAALTRHLWRSDRSEASELKHKIRSWPLIS